MRILQNTRFERSLKRLPRHVVDKAVQRTMLFERNPFDPRLDTHKLHGRLKHLWSFSVTSKIRILFEFDNSDVTFLDIGDHAIYQ